MTRAGASQVHLLRAHFFKGLLHNDLISPRGDTEIALIQVASVMAVPGLVFSYAAVKRYVVALAGSPPAVHDAVVLRDRALIVAFSMLATAFVGVLQWDRLRLDARDLRVLGPLPVARPKLAAAKALAVLQFLGLFALAVNLFTAAVFPLLTPPHTGDATLPLRHLLAHWIALAAASAFTAFLVTALSGMARYRAVQALVLVLLVQATFFLPSFAAALGTGALAALLLPPAWFVGLYGALAGDAPPHARELAALAPSALAACGAGLVLTCVRSVSEAALSPRAAPRSGGAHTGLVARVTNRFVPGRPASRAVFWFVLQTVTRSAPHRLRFSAWCGAGLALSGAPLLVYSAAAGASPAAWAEAWMRVSSVMVLFVLLGLWSAFAIPAALAANGVFRMSAERDAAACHAGTRRAATVLALVPTAVALWPIASVAGPWSAVGHLGFGAAWAVLSVELLFGRLPKIPFTCAYDPGQANLRVHWASYSIGALAYVTLAVIVEEHMLRGPGPFAIGLAGLGAAFAIARLRRTPGRELQFDEASGIRANPLGLTG